MWAHLTHKPSKIINLERLEKKQVKIFVIIPKGENGSKTFSTWMDFEASLGDRGHSFNPKTDVPDYVKNRAFVLKHVMNQIDKSDHRHFTISLPSIQFIDVFFSDVRAFLVEQLERYEKDIRIVLLKEKMVLNVYDDGPAELLKMLCHSQSKAFDYEKPADGNYFGIKKTKEEVINKIRADRKSGLSVRRMAKKYGVSMPTVVKYCKDIPSLYRRNLTTYKEDHEKSFDLSLVDALPITKEGRLYNVISSFLKSKRSENTRRTYYNHFKRFFEWASAADKNIEEFQNLREEDAWSFYEFLKNYRTKFDKEYSVKTINSIYESIQGFYSFSMKLGAIRKNPFVVVPKEIAEGLEVKTEAISDTDVNRLLDFMIDKLSKCAEDTAERQRNYRNLIAYLFLSTMGLRAFSIIGIKLKDLSLYDQRPFVMTKVKGQRGKAKKYLDPKLCETLKNYVNTYFFDEPEESYIIFSDIKEKARPLSHKNFNRLLKNAVKNAGISGAITAHSFRVYRITKWFKDGVEIREIQKRVDHKTMAQTEKYIKLIPQVPDEESIFSELKNLETLDNIITSNSEAS